MGISETPLQKLGREGRFFQGLPQSSCQMQARLEAYSSTILLLPYNLLQVLFFFFEGCAVKAIYVQRWKIWCGPVVLYMISSAAILSLVTGARQTIHNYSYSVCATFHFSTNRVQHWCFIQNSWLSNIHKFAVCCLFLCCLGGVWAILIRQKYHIL